MEQENVKNLATLAGIALGGYFLYKLSKGQSVSKSMKDTIEKPMEIAQDVADEVVKVGKKGLKYFAKGSPEAKAHMAKLRAKKTGKKKTSKKKKSNLITPKKITKKILKEEYSFNKKAPVTFNKKTPVTDQEVIKLNNLKGKKAEAVKNGKVSNLFTESEIEKINSNTDKNNHIENYMLISKKINSPLLGKFEALQRQRDKDAGLNANDSKVLYERYKALMKELKAITTEEEYKKIYGGL